MRLGNDAKRFIWTLLGVAAASVAGWAVAGLYGWIAVMLAGAALLVCLGLRPPPATENDAADAADEMVGVGLVPNAPLAEIVVAELRSNGIGASYRSVQPFGGANPVTNPEGQCEIMTHRSDAARARPFLLRSSAAPAQPRG